MTSRFVVAQNIARYQQLLEAAPTEAERSTLLRLLAEEQEKQRRLQAERGEPH